MTSAAALTETLGPDAAVSKSTASQICKAIHDQFEAFRTRHHLSGVDLAYLYVDASHFRYHHAAEFAAKWQARYPGAVACVTGDLDHLIAYLTFPAAHWRRIRHSNLIERTFGETRRRVKVIGRLPGERSCLGLVWAVLDRATGGWRGVTVTPADARLLARLRAQLEPASLPAPAGVIEGPADADAAEVTAA